MAARKKAAARAARAARPTGRAATAPAAAGVVSSPNAQIGVLVALLSQKMSALGTARAHLLIVLQHNPPSPTTITATIQNIDAEINKCISAINLVTNNAPIPFPTDPQIVALSNSVHALGNTIAQGGSALALIAAVNVAIATIPN